MRLSDLLAKREAEYERVARGDLTSDEGAVKKYVWDAKDFSRRVEADIMSCDPLRAARASKNMRNFYDSWVEMVGRLPPEEALEGFEEDDFLAQEKEIK